MARTTTIAPTREDARRPAGCGHVEIRLLGEISATVDGRAVPVLTGPRMTRLVARLALARGAGVPREQLAGELWPDSGTAQARTNLRKLLHDLRRSLSGPVELVDVGGRTVRWCAGPAVDVVMFIDAVARGDSAQAMNSYGGDLLPTCDDDWVVTERERLRRLAVDALSSLAASADAGGRDAEVVEHTRHLLRIDALHEPACRLLMRALARRGQRGEALRLYERLVARLDDDLGVAPEPATTAVAQGLRCAERGVGTGGALVGRATEWQTAHDAWRQAARGRAGVLCVAGEAGIGKTRLVEELARRVAADGYAVAHSRAYEAAGKPPWGSVIDWLRSEPVRSRLDTLDDIRLTELARLVPELRMAHPELPGTPPETDLGRRHHLLDAVCRGLLAVGRPLLLVLDDLQWCDTDTVELCQLLVQSAPSAPVLIACTIRNEDAAAAQLLGRLRHRLAAARGATVISLGPVDRSATAEMAATVGQRALSPDAATRLWRETEGNPLFIVEAIRSGFDARAPGSVALSPTVHALMTARLDRVSPTARSSCRDRRDDRPRVRDAGAGRRSGQERGRPGRRPRRALAAPPRQGPWRVLRLQPRQPARRRPRVDQSGPSTEAAPLRRRGDRAAARGATSGRSAPASPSTSRAQAWSSGLWRPTSGRRSTPTRCSPSTPASPCCSVPSGCSPSRPGAGTGTRSSCACSPPSGYRWSPGAATRHRMFATVTSAPSRCTAGSAAHPARPCSAVSRCRPSSPVGSTGPRTWPESSSRPEKSSAPPPSRASTCSA